MAHPGRVLRAGITVAPLGNERPNEEDKAQSGLPLLLTDDGARNVKISERTLYPFLAAFLKSIGVGAVSEIGAADTRGWTDLVCDVGPTRVVVEVRFGGPEDRMQLLLDAMKHARDERVTDYAILLYPEPPSRTILPGQIESLALDSDVLATPATRWWSEDLETPLKARDFLSQLFSQGARATPKIDFHSLVKRLQSRITSLSLSLRRALRRNGKAPLAQVVGRFESFVTLAGADPDDKEAMFRIRTAAIDLIAFLLVNQLVFYRIYRARKPDSGLPELPRHLTSLGELSEGFEKLADINYDPIFGIDLVSEIQHLTQADYLVEDVSALANSLPVLRPEEVSHDLAGRLFHDLLPQETRKTLGAFFTRPEAAELLASVAIRPRGEWSGTSVMDPACGSGTLLVAAYRRFRHIEKPTNLERFHREMNQERITGIDIMPFAASLTATNLAAQNVPATLLCARVGMADGLGLSSSAPSIPAFSTAIQTLLLDLGLSAPKKRAATKPRQAVALRRRGKSFEIRDVDYVVMNPPYSDWEKIPDEIKKGIAARTSLVERAGGTANLWQLFVIHTWGLVTKGGVYAAVLPINLFKGTTTSTVRQHLYANSTIEAIIVSEKEVAFSESSIYRDVLVVYRHLPPPEGHKVRVIHLHRSLVAGGIEGAARLGEALGAAIYDGASPPEDCWIEEVIQPRSISSDNLAARVFGSGTPERQRLERTLARILARGMGKLRALRPGEIWEGFGPRPKGLSGFVLVRRDTPGLQRPTYRTRQATLVLDRATKSRIEFFRKGPGGEEALRLATQISGTGDRANGALPALTTMAGIRTMDLGSDTDYVLISPYRGWEKVRALSSWSTRKDRTQMFSWKELVINPVRSKKTRLAIPDKLQLDSPDAFVLATYSKEPFVITNMLYGLTTKDAEEAALQALWLNSICTLAFFALRQSGALAGGMNRLKISDWVQHKLLETSSLTEKERAGLLSLVRSLGRVPLAPLKEQLVNDTSRKSIDLSILRLLGFTTKEAEELLPDLYGAVSAELTRAMDRLGGGEVEDSSQTTLDEHTN